MAGIGPRLTTWALQQVVSFLGYTGRAANVAATAESDPERNSRTTHNKRQRVLSRSKTAWAFGSCSS
jgi:hypothetical protein